MKEQIGKLIRSNVVAAAGIAITGTLAVVTAIDRSRDESPPLVVHPMTDLLTAPVEPGATVRASVTLPPGARVVAGSPLPTGEAFGRFQVLLTQQDTDTQVLTVTAKNTSADAVRFRANVQFTEDSK